MDTYEIDWTEHPLLHELDELVLDEFNTNTQKEFLSGAYRETYCIRDVKHTAKRWVEEHIETWKQVLQKIENLPDDTKQTYTCEETDEIIK